MSTQELNANEQAVLTYIESSATPVTIEQLAKGCFPHLAFSKANSWVRNSLRRMRDRLGIVRKVDRGRYTTALTPAIDIAEFQTSIRAAVYRTASGFHLGDDEISDIVQQVNEKLVRKLAMYNSGRAAAGTFIYTVARSTALDALRSRRRQPIQMELDEQAMTCDDALAVMMRQEQEQLVRSVVAELPDEERELAMHCMEDDFDLSAYAQSLGIARETLYVRKHRLMLKIGNALRNRLAA